MNTENARTRLSPFELVTEASEIGETTREFFAESWRGTRDGLLARTHRLRVEPDPGPFPMRFRFEFDLPYKRKAGPDAPVELVDGPLSGSILYRPDLMALDPDHREPTMAVFLDQGQKFFHPNFSRSFGMLCIGDIPPGPFPLDALLEHLYGIFTYQNRTPSDPADLEAARYFATDPEAMCGLETVEPLY